MKGKYKHHIVGGIVFIAVAVIFYPFLFARKDVDNPPVLTTPEPPSKPQIPHYVEPALAREALVDIADIGDGSILRTSPLQGGEISTLTEVDGSTTVSAHIVTEERSDSNAGLTQPESVASTQAPEPSVAMMGTDGFPVSWTLQLAALSSEENANVMVAKLRKTGQQAYVRESVAGGKTLFRVYIGPDLDRQRLDKLRPVIDKAYGVRSLTVRFLP